jgi:NAD(P)-dependent dehydrogenase (short-subunit alcohol dehydrogenase family)
MASARAPATASDQDRWSLRGQVALICGAGRGIGLGCARALAEAGAGVLLVSRTASEVEEAAEQITGAGGIARAHVADVTDEAQVAGAVAAALDLGDLRVCVNSAGTNRPGPSRSYPAGDWDALFDVNVRATFLVCRAVGDSLLSRGVPGSIVNLSSQMGTVGYPGRAAYCATKHAVEGLTKALGVEWAPDGVRVNAVAPTFVETPLTRPMLQDPEFRAEVERRLPTRELATIEQVADAVRYLACPASGSVTGSILRIDGGWTAW